MSGLNSQEINTLYKKGKRIYTTYFKVYFLSSDTLKVSPVVSKKISKKAVIRNKIKRRIRHLAMMNFKAGKYLIIAKVDISEVDFEKLKNDFKKISIEINKRV